MGVQIAKSWMECISIQIPLQVRSVSYLEQDCFSTTKPMRVREERLIHAV